MTTLPDLECFAERIRADRAQVEAPDRAVDIEYRVGRAAANQLLCVEGDHRNHWCAQMASVTYEEQLVDLIRSNERVMHLLRAVRSLGLAEWCVAAGTIRNLAWDHLHSLGSATLPTDIDVLIFDTTHTDTSYEHELEERLAAVVPSVQWEVVNQATIHAYTGDATPYTSIVDAMSRWADLVTAVGAHLDANDHITILAPGGLADLFELRVRPNIATPTSADVYRERMASKGWHHRWPLLTIEDVAD